jgi:spore coat polysaccharide biosynthesis protein SpsF
VKVVTIVQARTGSTRLPGKVMLPLAGKPLLQRQLERILAAKTEMTVVVATTTERSDDPVRSLCRDLGIRCFDGHPTDLLDRHYSAALLEEAGTAVKIPSDCPLIDPAIIDRVLQEWKSRNEELDYLSNLHPASYPDGNDIEVFTMEALETAWREASAGFEREHTTPFIWERPHRFRIGNVIWESGRNYSMTHRWTIDYPEDYMFIKAIYDELWNPARPVFTIEDILGLLERKPELSAINQRYAGVNWYRHHLKELKTISPEEVRHGHDQ